MSAIASMRMDSLLSRIARNAIVVLALTSLHHAYGAYLYQTPWRLHVLPVSGFAAVVILGSLMVLRRGYAVIASSVAFWMFTVVTLVLPVGVIGMFEGGYNHVLKNVLFFVGAPLSLMRMLFPSPVYEMPNSFFFEVTGVLQVVPAIMTGYPLWTLVRERDGLRIQRNQADAAAYVSTSTAIPKSDGRSSRCHS